MMRPSASELGELEGRKSNHTGLSPMPRYGKVERRSIKCLLLLPEEIPVKKRSPNYGSDAATPGE